MTNQTFLDAFNSFTTFGILAAIAVALFLILHFLTTNTKKSSKPRHQR